MKKYALVASALIIMILVFAGCSKTTDSTTPTTSMSATVGGQAFTATGISVTAKVSSGQLGVAGVSLSLQSITLSIATPTASIGSVAVDNIHGFAIYSSKPGAVVPAVSGVITFTEVSPNLVGTFSVTLNDSTQITNGAFSVPAP